MASRGYDTSLEGDDLGQDSIPIAPVLTQLLPLSRDFAEGRYFGNIDEANYFFNPNSLELITSARLESNPLEPSMTGFDSNDITHGHHGWQRSPGAPEYIGPVVINNFNLTLDSRVYGAQHEHAPHFPMEQYHNPNGEIPYVTQLALDRMHVMAAVSMQDHHVLGRANPSSRNVSVFSESGNGRERQTRVRELANAQSRIMLSRPSRSPPPECVVIDSESDEELERRENHQSVFHPHIDDFYQQLIMGPPRTVHQPTVNGQRSDRLSLSKDIQGQVSDSAHESQGSCQPTSGQQMMGPNPQHPHAQMIPLDSAGNRIRPTSRRLPPMEVRAEAIEAPSTTDIFPRRGPQLYSRRIPKHENSVDLGQPYRNKEEPPTDLGQAHRHKGKSPIDLGQPHRYKGGPPINPGQPHNYRRAFAPYIRAPGHRMPDHFPVIPRRRPRHENVQDGDSEGGGRGDEEIDLRYDRRQRRLVFAQQPDPQNSDEDSSDAPIGLRYSNVSQPSVLNQHNQSQEGPRKAKQWYGKQGGEVRFEGYTNNFQVRDPDTYEWRDAVRHDDVRGILLRNAGSVNQYRYPRARGPGPYDQTSYLPIERDWGLGRPDGWDRILDQILYRFERNDYEPPAWLRREPGYMMHNGRIVIDRNNHPIKDWPLIPATLSSQFEGGFMEAIRRICRGISTRDFWVRMPEAVVSPDRNGQKGVTIGVTALGNRQERFRLKNGLIAWTFRGRSKNPLREAIWAKLSPADRRNNTTRNFVGLTKAELTFIKSQNKGCPASVAKSRAHQARQKREEQRRQLDKSMQTEQNVGDTEPSADEFGSQEEIESDESDGA